MHSILDRTDVARGALDEYEAFAALIEPLDAAAWDAPTRCEGFLVRDVAGHVVGLAEDVAKGVPGSRNAEEEAASVRGDSPHGSRPVCARRSTRCARCSARSTTAPGMVRAGCPTSPSAEAYSRSGTTRSCTPTTSAPRSAARRKPGPGSRRASSTSRAS